MTACGQGGVGRGLTFTKWIGGLISQNMWMGCHWHYLRWRNWGLVACLTSLGSWEGLSCSLLPPDSLSDSPTGWALAQVPEICSARASGSQSTCPWSPGPYNFSFSRWESFQCKWSKIYFLDRTGNVAETKKATLALSKKAPLSV